MSLIIGAFAFAACVLALAVMSHLAGGEPRGCAGPSDDGGCCRDLEVADRCRRARIP